jgi:hypothetical protein
MDLERHALIHPSSPTLEILDFNGKVLYGILVGIADIDWHGTAIIH